MDISQQFRTFALTKHMTAPQIGSLTVTRG